MSKFKGKEEMVQKGQIYAYLEHVINNLETDSKMGQAAVMMCEHIGEWIEALDGVSLDVVHCKDCANWKNESQCLAWSRYGKITTKPDQFCSYGKRG